MSLTTITSDRQKQLKKDSYTMCCLFVSDPLLMTGGEVGDKDGQALLGGGGSGGGGGGGESCPSSSEELSRVRSITSTFLLLLLSPPLWPDEEEVR